MKKLADAWRRSRHEPIELTSRQRGNAVWGWWLSARDWEFGFGWLDDRDYGQFAFSVAFGPIAWGLTIVRESR